jgi:hypothetical protein
MANRDFVLYFIKYTNKSFLFEAIKYKNTLIIRKFNSLRDPHTKSRVKYAYLMQKILFIYFFAIKITVFIEILSFFQEKIYLGLLFLSFYFFFYSFIYMCIHCLGHCSPLPPTPPSSPNACTSKQNLFCLYL